MPDYVELNHDGIVRETEGAVLYDLGDRQVWIPRSLLRADSGDESIIEVPFWFAEKEGLV